MNKNAKIVFTISLSIALITISIGVIYQTQEKTQTSDSSNTTDISTLPITVSLSQSPNSTENLNSVNITKGQTITMNVNLRINSDHTDLTMPLYLSVGAFENKPSTKIIATPPSPYPYLPWSGHDDSPNMAKPFEATFNPNPINLKANQNASAILTITALGDAQAGTYSLVVEIGNWKETSVGGASFNLKVLPK